MLPLTALAAETNGEYEAGTESGHTEDNKTETANGEGEDEDLEAIQVGSVHDGNVVNTEGEVIGHINGGEASQFEGSIVDQEGDILVSLSSSRVFCQC